MVAPVHIRRHAYPNSGMAKDGGNARGDAIYWPSLKENQEKAEAFCRLWKPKLERAGAGRVSAIRGEAVDADSNPVPSVWDYLDLREAGKKLVPPFYDHEMKALRLIEGSFTHKDGTALPIKFEMPRRPAATPAQVLPVPLPAKAGAPARAVPPKVPPRVPPRAPTPALTPPTPPRGEPDADPEGEREEVLEPEENGDQEVPIEPHPADEPVDDASDFSSVEDVREPVGPVQPRPDPPRAAPSPTGPPAAPAPEKGHRDDGTRDRRKLQAALILRTWDLKDGGIQSKDDLVVALIADQPGGRMRDYVRAVEFALESDLTNSAPTVFGL